MFRPLVGTAYNALICYVLRIGILVLLLSTLSDCSSIVPGQIPVELGRTWIRRENVIYGAHNSKEDVFGGGSQNLVKIVSGEFVVRTIAEFQCAIEEAKYGDTIFLPSDVVLDFTALVFAEKYSIRVPAGVTLASDRGKDGSLGAVIRSLAFDTPALIVAQGPGVRVTGLRVEGADKERRTDHHDRSYGNPVDPVIRILGGSEYFYRFPNSKGIVTDHAGLEVDNCELWGWSHAAISLISGADHHIHHNYIHHNQREGLGYGISHRSAYSIIEYNVFNYNRHSIAGTGVHPSGYIARYNVQLNESLSHAFDMHGGIDRRDGTNIAGTRIEIYNNVFYNETRAIAIRGTPADSAVISHNWFFHEQLGDDVIKDWPDSENVIVHDNEYGARLPKRFLREQ